MEFPWLENSCMVENNFTGAGMINKVMFKQVQSFRRHVAAGRFIFRSGNSPCREKTTSYSFLDIL